MWLLFAFLSAITAALMTIVGKIGIKNLDTTFATGIRSFIMFLFMSVVVVASSKLKHLAELDRRSIGIIAISAIFGAASWFFYFLALKNAPATKVAAIDRLSLVFVIVFSVLFLSQKLNVTLAIGTILATIGIILITLA